MSGSAHLPLVTIYDALRAEWLHFEQPLQIVSVVDPADVLAGLREVETLVERNAWHAAGFVSYEAAPAFDPALATRPAAGYPLLWFGLYNAPQRTSATPARVEDYRLGDWTADTAPATYARAIRRIKRHIARGQTYQVNHTFRLHSSFSGDPRSLFADMLSRQPGGYPAFIDTGGQAICCASPELFFRLEGERVTCRPMKGTAPRGRTLQEDQARAGWLRASEKNRAENVMIVDMLRNDLGRVARTGSVRVSELFQVERYPTLWQMTSTVEARSTASFSELFAALFPSASITGAPKASTMKIIAALEQTPRRVYTGTIGYLAPGRQAQFNVAIRTVLIDREQGMAEYGVGGGVVWDSTAADEYAEALLKGRFLTTPSPEFSLLETLRWTPGEGWFVLERHLERLRNSAEYFGFSYDEAQIRSRLEEAVAKASTDPRRVRLLLARDGRLVVESLALPARSEDQTLLVSLAAEPVDSRDVLLYHKTTRREVYEQARSARPGCDDVLLYNQRDELTESTIANLVVELDGKLFTPPVSCGLLAGTLRAQLLEDGRIEERVITREDLPRCTRLFLVNSVRGWQRAELV